MKKILVLIMVICLTALSFVACKKANKDSGNEGTSTSESVITVVYTYEESETVGEITASMKLTLYSDNTAEVVTKYGDEEEKQNGTWVKKDADTVTVTVDDEPVDFKVLSNGTLELENVGGNEGGNVGGNEGGNVGGNEGGNEGGNDAGNEGGNVGGDVSVAYTYEMNQTIEGTAVSMKMTLYSDNTAEVFSKYGDIEVNQNGTWVQKDADTVTVTVDNEPMDFKVLADGKTLEMDFGGGNVGGNEGGNVGGNVSVAYTYEMNQEIQGTTISMKMTLYSDYTAEVIATVGGQEQRQNGTWVQKDADTVTVTVDNEPMDFKVLADGKTLEMDVSGGNVGENEENVGEGTVVEGPTQEKK